MGWAAETAGDVNGDGYADIIVGAREYDNGQTNEGAAFIWCGSAGGMGPEGTPGNADWSAEMDQAEARFGYIVGTAGDVTNDGYDDIVVAANEYDDGPQANAGQVYVYEGSAAGVSATPSFTATGDFN